MHAVDCKTRTPMNTAKVKKKERKITTLLLKRRSFVEELVGARVS